MKKKKCLKSAQRSELELCTFSDSIPEEKEVGGEVSSYLDKTMGDEDLQMKELR